MASKLTHTHVEKYTLGRGELWVAEIVNGKEQGARFMGNCPTFNVTVESELLDHFSSKGGVQEKDDSVTLQVNRNGELVTDNASNENFALFLAAILSQQTQAGATETRELLAATGIETERYYQLGQTAANPPGARNVTAVSVFLADDAAARANDEVVLMGDIRKVGTDLFIAKTAGTAASSPPSFNTTAVGDETTDGTITWRFLGDHDIAYTVDQDYKLNATQARIMPIEAANSELKKVADELAAYGGSLGMDVTYTTAAKTWDRIATAGVASVNVAIYFKSDNPKGDNRDFYAPDVTIRPSGAMGFISGGEWATMTYALEFNKRDDSTAAIYLDGQPVA